MIAASLPVISSVWKGLKDMVQGWSRFWFTPADPTLLGFMRICCGLVVLYVHIAYTSDLQELFGKNAWISQDSINNYRREVPWPLNPSASRRG